MVFTTFKAGDYKDNKNTLNKKMIQSFGIFFTVNMLVYYFLIMIVLYLFNDLIFLG